MRLYAPFLWELLVRDTFRDESRRELPTIVIDRVDGGYQVRLQDHASRQQIVTSCRTLAEVAMAIEGSLTSGQDCWRPYASKKVPNPRRRKKPDGTWTKE